MKVGIINLLFVIGLILLLVMIEFDWHRLHIGFIVYFIVWLLLIVFIDSKQKNK